MKRHSLGLLMLAIISGLVLADAKPSAEAEKLLGAWDIVSTEIKGKTYPAPEISSGTIVFAKDNRLILKDKSQKDKKGTYQIDPSKDPKELDLTKFKEGSKEGNKMPTIYEIDGDKLRIAFPPEGDKGKRPTIFDSNKALIITLKRQKK
jgi:uncharacterized protein (TIGR03067 family)